MQRFTLQMCAFLKSSRPGKAVVGKNFYIDFFFHLAWVKKKCRCLGFVALGMALGMGFVVKIGLGTGIWAKFGLGNGIWTLPPPLQDPLLRGTRIPFFGCDSHNTRLRGTKNRLTNNYFLSYFSAQYTKGYRHNSNGSNFRF